MTALGPGIFRKLGLFQTPLSIICSLEFISIGKIFTLLESFKFYSFKFYSFFHISSHLPGFPLDSAEITLGSFIFQFLFPGIKSYLLRALPCTLAFSSYTSHKSVNVPSFFHSGPQKCKSPALQDQMSHAYICTPRSPSTESRVPQWLLVTFLRVNTSHHPLEYPWL